MTDITDIQLTSGHPEVITALRRHGFNAFSVAGEQEAGQLIGRQFDALRQEYLRAEKEMTVSYGDSLTLYAVGILEKLKNTPHIKFLDGFDKSKTRVENLGIRRQAVLSDFYLTGVNAISRDGALYWVDMIGNRIAPVAMGAGQVVIVAGSNKIVPSKDDLDHRVRNTAAPMNIARHPGFKTPCAKTGVCMDCNSPDRICNMRLLMERCYPKGRITVIIINKMLGL